MNIKIYQYIYNYSIISFDLNTYGDPKYLIRKLNIKIC